MNRRVFIGLIILVVLLGAAIFLQRQDGDMSQSQPSDEQFAATTTDREVLRPQSLTIGDTCVDVDLAVTFAERRQGLSGRPSLAPGNGMLFIYQEDGDHSIWMKDMNFSIDIIWLDADKNVIDFRENVAPETFPEGFVSDDPSRYVLEVPAGFVKRHDVTTGERVSFQAKSCGAVL